MFRVRCGFAAVLLGALTIFIVLAPLVVVYSIFLQYDDWRDHIAHVVGGVATGSASQVQSSLMQLTFEVSLYATLVCDMLDADRSADSSSAAAWEPTCSRSILTFMMQTMQANPTLGGLWIGWPDGSLIAAIESPGRGAVCSIPETAHRFSTLYAQPNETLKAFSKRIPYGRPTNGTFEEFEQRFAFNATERIWWPQNGSCPSGTRFSPVYYSVGRRTAVAIVVAFYHDADGTITRTPPADCQGPDFLLGAEVLSQEMIFLKNSSSRHQWVLEQSTGKIMFDNSAEADLVVGTEYNNPVVFGIASLITAANKSIIAPSSGWIHNTYFTAEQLVLPGNTFVIVTAVTTDRDKAPNVVVMIWCLISIPIMSLLLACFWIFVKRPFADLTRTLRGFVGYGAWPEGQELPLPLLALRSSGDFADFGGALHAYVVATSNLLTSVGTTHGVFSQLMTFNIEVRTVLHRLKELTVTMSDSDMQDQIFKLLQPIMSITFVSSIIMAQAADLSTMEFQSIFLSDIITLLDRREKDSKLVFSATHGDPVIHAPAEQAFAFLLMGAQGAASVLEPGGQITSYIGTCTVEEFRQLSFLPELSESLNLVTPEVVAPSLVPKITSTRLCYIVMHPQGKLVPCPPASTNLLQISCRVRELPLRDAALDYFLQSMNAHYAVARNSDGSYILAFAFRQAPHAAQSSSPLSIREATFPLEMMNSSRSGSFLMQISNHPSTGSECQMQKTPATIE